MHKCARYSLLFLTTVMVVASPFASAQTHIWSKGLHADSTANSIGASALVYRSGSIFATGSLSGTVDLGGGPLTAAGSGDILVARFDNDGNHIWSQIFGDRNSDRGLDIAADSLGNVFVTGDFTNTVDFGGGPFTSDTAWHAFLVKFDGDGNHIWSKDLGNPMDSSVGYSLVVDSADNVILTGYFRSTFDFGDGTLTAAGTNRDIFLVKYDSAGKHIWSRVYGDTFVDVGLEIAIDSVDNIFLTGVFANTLDLGGSVMTATGVLDSYLAKFDANGNHLWSQSFNVFGFTSSNGERGSKIAIDATGNVFMAGSFVDTVDLGGGALFGIDGHDVFAAKFDPNGAHLWSRDYSGLDFDFVASAAPLRSGGFVLTGRFWGDIDFGAGPLTSVGNSDLFLVYLSSTGDLVSASAFGSLGGDSGSFVTVDTAGDVVVTGIFGNQLDLGGGPLISPVFDGMFIAKFGPPAFSAGGSGGSSNGGGCFIATATYGTPMAEEVDTLRDVRDIFLLNCALGAAVVDTYYRISPSVANAISQSDGLRGIVRMLLTPIVLMSEALLVAPGMLIFVMFVLNLVIGIGYQIHMRDAELLGTRTE